MSVIWSSVTGCRERSKVRWVGKGLKVDVILSLIGWKEDLRLVISL